MRIHELLYENQSPVVDSSHVFSAVKQIHRRYEDLSEGDLTDRIYWFDYYTLTELPLSNLNLSEWDIDEDLVASHVAKIMKSRNTTPPIVFDPTANSIIDGVHRANAYVKLGYDTIPAYVGSKKSDSYGEYSSEY